MQTPSSFGASDNEVSAAADQKFPRALPEDRLYECGYTLYQQQKFEQATRIFLQLTMQQPFSGRYLYALGACLQAQGIYGYASQVYALCRSLEPTNPLAAFHQGECRLQIGERDGAKADFRDAARLAESLPQWSSLAQRARGLADLLDVGYDTTQGSEPAPAQGH